MMRINEQIRCYLTKQAQLEVDALKRAGFDEDLALTMLEQLWPEDAIYELSEDGTEASD